MAASPIRPAVTAAVFCALFWSAAAHGQDGLRWHTFQYDDDEEGQQVGRLVYGVPETDNAQLIASCTTGRPGSVLTVSGPVAGLSDGEEATLQLTSRRFSQDMAGTIQRPQSEEGLAGIKVAVAHNDALWQTLRRRREVRYSINGSEAVPLELRGSAKPIRTYLQFCKKIAQFGADPAATIHSTPASDPRWDTCSAFGNIRSVKSDTPVTVKFVNRTDSYRGVMWVNFEGMPVEYATLDPGQTSTVNTYVTHPWMFSDGPGNCIEMFMPQPGIPVFEITAPNRDFGPE